MEYVGVEQKAKLKSPTPTLKTCYYFRTMDWTDEYAADLAVRILQQSDQEDKGTFKKTEEYLTTK